MGIELTPEQERQLDGFIINRSGLLETKEIKIDLFIRENVIDSEGDKWSSETLQGFHNKRVHICQDFNPAKLLGVGVIFYEQGRGCGAVVRISKDFDERGLYPCIEFRAKKYEGGEYSNCEVLGISLCTSQNSDKGIKAL